MMEVILKNIDEFVAPVNNTLQGKFAYFYFSENSVQNYQKSSQKNKLNCC